MANLKKDALKSNPLKAEAIPATYCASGKAFCQDFDFARTCICNVCPVYLSYKLKGGKPPLYFCRNGVAQ
jgi:hypothetical protein